jgi:hypothetical protein
VIGEVLNNLPEFPTSASAQWAKFRADLLVLDDVLTLDRPAIFPAGKDRPILFSAVAWADVLVTAYSDEIATESDAKRHAFRRKSAVREVGAKRRWDFVHNLRGLVFASQVIISWFF